MAKAEVEEKEDEDRLGIEGLANVFKGIWQPGFFLYLFFTGREGYVPFPPAVSTGGGGGGNVEQLTLTITPNPASQAGGPITVTVVGNAFVGAGPFIIYSNGTPASLAAITLNTPTPYGLGNFPPGSYAMQVQDQATTVFSNIVNLVVTA